MNCKLSEHTTELSDDITSARGKQKLMIETLNRDRRSLFAGDKIMSHFSFRGSSPHLTQVKVKHFILNLYLNICFTFKSEYHREKWHISAPLVKSRFNRIFHFDTESHSFFQTILRNIFDTYKTFLFENSYAMILWY